MDILLVQSLLWLVGFTARKVCVLYPLIIWEPVFRKEASRGSVLTGSFQVLYPKCTASSVTRSYLQLLNLPFRVLRIRKKTTIVQRVNGERCESQVQAQLITLTSGTMYCPYRQQPAISEKSLAGDDSVGAMFVQLWGSRALEKLLSVGFLEMGFCLCSGVKITKAVVP